MSRPIVDGKPVDLELQVPSVYAAVVARQRAASERSLDRLVESVEELIMALNPELDELSRSRLTRDARAALKAHEEDCDCVVWWTHALLGS
jgi:hypothetical protein